MNTDFHISTDSSRLDIDMIYNYLSANSYWAKDRTSEKVTKSIENSFCFGVYTENKQVGFARVVTDYAVFAWVLDLFIVEDHQGKGLGKLLMESIVNHLDLQMVRRWGLNTKDAHGLYERYGFKKIDDPEIHMQRIVG
ncbi:MAG: GNAT family N-acetyltransferase [Bacteroidota bacterium]